MIPMAYILVLGEIDISVGATVCLSATLSCIMCNTGAPFIVVILTALIVGTVCGAVNGFILTQFEELPPMIVTLATQIISVVLPRSYWEVVEVSQHPIQMASVLLVEK